MTRLEDLLHSLATVLVRYHDTQGIKVLITETNPILLQKKSRELAITILKDTDVRFDKRLNDLIKECTHPYPARSPLLCYILNEITYLKSLVDRRSSFSGPQLDDYKNQLTQMLINFRQLLITVKSTTFKVKYSRDAESSPNILISLSGLINNSYLGSSLCNSGSLLTKEVFERLNITPTSSDEEIRVIVENICTEHQHSLLIPELLAHNSRLLELTSGQKTTIESLEPKIGLAETRASEQSATIESLTVKLGHAESRVSDHGATIESLTVKLGHAESRVSDHDATIESLTVKLGHAESRVSDHGATIESLTVKLGQAESRVSEHGATIESLTVKLGQAESRVSDHGATIESLTVKLGQAESRVSEQSVTVESLTVKLGQAGSRVSEQSAAIESLLSKHEKSENRCKELEELSLILETRVSLLSRGISKPMAAAMTYATLFGSKFPHLKAPPTQEPRVTPEPLI